VDFSGFGPGIYILKAEKNARVFGPRVVKQ
jgi:hypothetical protein